MHVTKVPCCDFHYGEGSREIRMYRGPIYQNGSGFFGDLFRRILPIFMNKVLPYIGSKLSQGGEHLANEVAQGTPFKEAIKKTAKRTFSEGKADVLKKMMGGGITKPYKRSKKTRNKRITKQRFFALGA